MNQAPIEQQLSTKQPSEKTLLEQIRKELWPVAQQLLRTLNSMLKVAPLTVTTNTTLDGVNDLILADATAGNLLLTLPAAQTWMRAIAVIKVDGTANTVTLGTVVSGNPVLAAQWAHTTVTQDGTSFYEI